MAGYLRLTRPLNAAMSAAGVAVAGLVAVGPSTVASRALPILFAAVAAALFTGAGNGLNDYFDRFHTVRMENFKLADEEIIGGDHGAIIVQPTGARHA